MLAVVCQTQPSSASSAAQIICERSRCEPHCKPPNASAKLTQSTAAPSPITAHSAAGAEKIEGKLKHCSIEKNSVSYCQIFAQDCVVFHWGASVIPNSNEEQCCCCYTVIFHQVRSLYAQLILDCHVNSGHMIW
ncbi:hypothetical protein CFP56_039747 [Quercus suber]|uniref:Uncharacterized protein n=1 Tax=Quercus suber TaxID=58331 RepID=A0AAW0MC31_QUESU